MITMEKFLKRKNHNKFIEAKNPKNLGKERNFALRHFAKEVLFVYFFLFSEQKF
jgi:hypothetical protein